MSISNNIIIRSPVFVEKEEIKDVEKEKQQLSLFSSSSQNNRNDDYCPETHFFGEPLPDVRDTNENDFTRNKQNFQLHSRNRDAGFAVNGILEQHFSLKDVMFCVLTGVVVSVIVFGVLFMLVGAIL